MKPRYNTKEYVPTLCWKCANARANRCPRFTRSNYDEPMDIWEEYKETSVRLGNGNENTEVTSFVVIKCKNFVPDPVKRKTLEEVFVRKYQEVLN